MKPDNYLSQDESAELKQRLKRHWQLWGYNAPLPNDLAAAPNKYPCEWAEACQEWEGRTPMHPMNRYMLGRS